MSPYFTRFARLLDDETQVWYIEVNAFGNYTYNGRLTFAISLLYVCYVNFLF